MEVEMSLLSSPTVLRLVDSMAILLNQAYQLARARLASAGSSCHRSRFAEGTIAATRDCRSSRSPYGWRPDVPPCSLVKESPLVLCAHFGAPVHGGTHRLRARPGRRFRSTFSQRRATVRTPGKWAGQLAGPPQPLQDRQEGTPRKTISPHRPDGDRRRLVG